MRSRRLVLSKETLSEMTTDEMVNVKGAMPVITPVRGCVENLASKVIECMSVFDPCPTR
jgi:hypothetical protein